MKEIMICKKAKTLISENHYKLAQNKSLVRATIGGKSISTLINSGPQSNIMNAKIFMKINKKTTDLPQSIDHNLNEDKSSEN